MGIQLCDAINIVKQTENELSRVQGEVANKVNAKLHSVFERNPVHSTLCRISDILWGNEAELGGNEQELLPTIRLFFKYSAVTSCDEERSFSRCMVLLSDNRGSKPAEAVGFFGRKNPQDAFLRRGSKRICPMSQLCGMSKNLVIHLNYGLLVKFQV